MGEEGRELGRLSRPRLLTVMPGEELLVYEIDTDRVQRWSATGDALGRWLDIEHLSDLVAVPAAGPAGPEILSLEGNCLVRRTLDSSVIGRIDVYPDLPVRDGCIADDDSLETIDSSSDATRPVRREGWRDRTSGPDSIDSTMSLPFGARAAARAADGSFVVTTAGEVRHFSPSGALLSAQGNLGRGRGEFLDANDVVAMPADIDPEGPFPPGAIVVADTENIRLQVYGRRRELWRVELFDNPWFMGYPTHITTTESVDLDWASERHVPEAPSDRFSARFDRWMSLPGTVRIRLETRGGARLWAGEELVVDDWYAEAMDVERFVSLPEGDHLVRLELNGTAGESAIRFDLDVGDVPTPTPTHTVIQRVFLPWTRR